MGRITILGGAGAMALATLHDLMETVGPASIVIADVNESALQQRMQASNDPRITGRYCDATDPRSLDEACAGSDVVINCTNAGELLPALEAALRVGSHYLDLGGWPAETADQLDLGPRFQAAGRVAVFGMGSAPGISNVMAAAAAACLETVSAIHIKLAKTYVSTSSVPLNPPYALATILEELTVAPLILQDGHLVEVPAQSGREILMCPAPMGEVEIMHVIHPEPFTFAKSFSGKGLQDASFKIGLPRDFLDRMQFLLSLGLGIDRTLAVGKTQVNLRDLLLTLVPARSEVIDPAYPPHDYGYTVVIAQGGQAHRRVEIQAELFGLDHQRWGLSGGTVRTGVPVSIVAQMLLRDQITRPGCFAPEQCVPPRSFFTELARRNMRIYLTQHEPGFEEP